MKAKLFVMMVLASVALVSCQNDDYEFGDNRPARPGDEIVFGGRMEYKSTRTDNTRTVYGDKGNTGTEIKWYQGDMVRIYCAEANLGENGGDQKYCDYQVTDFITALGGNNSNPIDGKYETNHSTGLRTPDGSTGLCWGTGAHDFYALYPSPAMLNKNGEDNVVVNSLKIEGKTVTAYLPNLQAPSAFVAPTTDAESKNKHYTIHPAMRYAYMVASATGKQPTDNNNVSLTFNPIITAVEMTIVNGGNATIEGVQMVSLSSENTICGEFSVEDVSVDVKDMTIKHSSSGDSYNIVSVPVAETGKTIDLNPGDTLTFTAFLALNADLNKITTTIVYANGVATRKATLTGNNGVNIVQAKKKNFITKLEASFSKAVSKVELNQWMASISNTIEGGTTARTLASLSIPAAGGAASGHTTDWDKNEKYLEQKLTIEDLWDQGIRCFEFTVDNADDFGGQKVYCNSKPSNITLTEAVNKVKSKLIDNPTEFAMVIITYQDNDGWADRDETEGGVVKKNRDPKEFMTNLNNFWSNITFNKSTVTTNTIDGQTTITFGKLLYSPTTNLGNARGKLFCIARPTSQGEDNYPEITTAQGGLLSKYTYISKTTIDNSLTTFTQNDEIKASNDILVIDGWGTLKDKWEARGFTKSPYKRGRGNDNYGEAKPDDSVAKDNLPGRPFDASREPEDDIWRTLENYKNGTSTITLTPNFTYSTSSGVDAWVQEWARVIKENATFEITPRGDDGYGQYVQWIESYTEKKNHITQTLDFALYKGKGDIIYINSLCGYYAENNDNDKNSILPNELTDMSLGKTSNTRRKRYSPVTASSATAGMCGNISDYAYDINNYFYNYLLKKSLNGKSTGIIMMDRVSNDATANPAGYYIPRIILANNPFATGTITPTVPTSTVEGDDALLSRKNFSVTWDK